MSKAKTKKTIHTSGKRKTAIARATLTPGTGIVRINSVNLENFQPSFARQKISEPFMLMGGVGNVDINIRVFGGGTTSQAEAARLAAARALVEHNSNLKTMFLDYDRTLLVADVRRKEVSKPNSQGSARSKRQKSYR
ncbi:30S ribosomal protein S9 [Candidatus Woesearchaeota archaeon]|nr:30S ribosomal protein S9 [Candidatus Woesearchaeota archaeon]